VSLWVKLAPASTDVNAWILDHMYGAGVSWKGWHSWILADNTFIRRTTSASVGTLYDGNWHHIAGTHDGVTTARLYFDGNRVAETTTYAYTPPPTTQVMTLNRLNQTPIYPGEVDDVSVWNGAMSATEVVALFNDGLGVTPGNQAALALEGFASPAPTLQPYTVANADMNVSHTINIAEVDAGGAAMDYAWLSLSASQLALASASSGTVTATIDHVTPAMTPGIHTAYLKFSDDAVPAHTVTRRIQLTVLGCQWATITPGSVKRYYIDGSGDPPVGPVVYTVANTGKHGLTYTVQEVVDQPWLTLNKAGGGPLNYQATDTVTATIDKTGLAVGQYTCDIRFTNNCNPADTVDYTVTLNILPSNYTVSEPGLLAYYRFEETFKDWTGNGWNGTSTGAPTFEEGQNGRSIQFHGISTTDGVDLGDIPCPASTAAPDMSVALWYRGRAEDIEIDASWLINKITSAGGWKGWQMKVDHEWFGLDWQVNTFQFRWCHDGLRDSLDTSAPNRNIAIPSLYDGNWHFIVFTIEDADGALGNLVNVRAYYDGALIQGQNIWSQTPEIITFERLNTPFEAAPVDTNVWLSGDVDRVMGGVDELSLWNRALSAAEIAYMYENGLVDKLPWPDSDEDGDVDTDDFAAFQRCFTIGTGGGITDPDTCGRFDHDFDNDIDETDLNAFVKCGTGPGVPLDEANPPIGCDL
jgi:hypothetical protein